MASSSGSESESGSSGYAEDVPKAAAETSTASSSSAAVGAEAASGGAQPQPEPEPEQPRQPDPSQPGRTVKHKKANSAFLVHQRWKEDQKAQRRAAGKGEDERPLEVPSFRIFLKYTLLALLAALALGQFITGDVLYGYEGKWRNPRKWLPTKPREFTPGELALYNGRDESRPVYLSILGNVYDVTAGGPTYRPGGSYWFFAGKDASRAFVTGCFKTHLTHDLRGLSDGDVQQVRQWNSFFEESPKYFKVGTLRLPRIDPDSPVPEPCD
ncbi:unnamed protein product [Parajaminaea phylloscopi]